MRDCEPGDGPNAVCFKVASVTSSIRRHHRTRSTRSASASTRRGVAEPSVADDERSSSSSRPDKDDTAETRDLIARTAKLEFKVVDDGSKPGQAGSGGAQFMIDLFNHVGYLDKAEAAVADRKPGDATDPLAIQLGVWAEIDQWRPEEADGVHTDYYLKAYDRTGEPISAEEARRSAASRRTTRQKAARRSSANTPAAIQGLAAHRQVPRPDRGEGSQVQGP
jgi:hypothetical protein